MVLKITEEQIKNLDLERLTKVVNQGYEDVQVAVNNTKEDHRFPQGMLVILSDLKTILSKTSRKS